MPNAKTTYSLPYGSDIISVTKSGKISSNDLLGTAVVLVQATESDSAHIQELSLLVQVKSVSYMMLNAAQVIEEPKTTTVAPPPTTTTTITATIRITATR